MAEPVRYYTRQFQILEVPVHLGIEVNEDLIRREKPDAVIMATGGVPGEWPPIEGVENGQAPGVTIVNARDVLAGKDAPGDHIALLATDQGMEGLTTAEYLADRGKQVEVLIPYPNVGAKLEWLVTRWVITDRVTRKGVRLRIMTGVKAVRDGVIYTYFPPSGPEEPLEGVRALVIAAGSRANDELWKALRGQVNEIYGAGECVAPRRLMHSSLDGLKAGLRV